MNTHDKSALILIAFTAVVATLLLSGLTLAPLARLLGIREALSSTGEIRNLSTELTRSGQEVLGDPELIAVAARDTRWKSANSAVKSCGVRHPP
ncbi:hypothetical protein [Gryllotalpicola kribbensis]|uniref:hypothetical protein n=1 Tax=Gryllotalpicola kribbensis TaxID=993084 RepID=UPI0031E02AFB